MNVYAVRIVTHGRTFRDSWSIGEATDNPRRLVASHLCRLRRERRHFRRGSAWTLEVTGPRFKWSRDLVAH